MNKEQGMMNDEVGGLFWIDRLRVLRRTQCGIFPLSKSTWPKIAVPNISSFEHFRWISKQDRKFFGRRHDAEWCANVLFYRTLTAEVVIKKTDCGTLPAPHFSPASANYRAKNCKRKI